MSFEEVPPFPTHRLCEVTERGQVLELIRISDHAQPTAAVRQVDRSIANTCLSLSIHVIGAAGVAVWPDERRALSRLPRVT
jgi:hypothetical protein